MSEEIKVVSKNKINKKLLFSVAALLAIALVAVLIVFVPKAANARRLEEQLSLGNKYLSELKYEQAVAAYLAAIEIDPKNVEAQIKLADIYLAKEEPEAALQALQAALQASSPPAVALTLMRVVDELIVGSDILTVLEEAGILDELPVEEILSALVSAVGEG